jgi:beta-phosphoglucomutase-like phosphatase (HAD superfamily)
VPLRAVLFDAEGTLVDPSDQHAAVWTDASAEIWPDVAFAEACARSGKDRDQLMPVLVAFPFTGRGAR